MNVEWHVHIKSDLWGFNLWEEASITILGYPLEKKKVRICRVCICTCKCAYTCMLWFLKIAAFVCSAPHDMQLSGNETKLW